MNLFFSLEQFVPKMDQVKLNQHAYVFVGFKQSTVSPVEAAEQGLRSQRLRSDFTLWQVGNLRAMQVMLYKEKGLKE